MRRRTFKRQVRRVPASVQAVTAQLNSAVKQVENVQEKSAKRVENVQQKAVAEIKNVQENTTEKIETMEENLKKQREKGWNVVNKKIREIQNTPVTKMDFYRYVQQHLKRPENPTDEEIERLGVAGAQKKLEDEYIEAYKTLKNKIDDELEKIAEQKLNIKNNYNIDSAIKYAEKEHQLFGVREYVINELSGERYMGGGRRGRGKTIKQRGGKKGRGASRRR
jgi:hypothetical protein